MNEDFPNQPRQPRRSGRRGRVVLALVLAFVLGAGAMVAGLWYSGMNPLRALTAPLTGMAAVPLAPMNPAAVPSTPAAIAQVQGGLELRVAGLEQRLARLDVASAEAQSNTARAEALLIAFATRRSVERGVPLGYLEEQLKARFGNAQPTAVATIIAGAHDPVTLDRLAAQLESMAPKLANAPADEPAWARLKREMANLFVVRHEAGTPLADPGMRLDHARIALREGRIGDAIGDVQRLPGSAVAQGWIEAARRYADVDSALDRIESTALLSPRTLRDGTSGPLGEPMPIIPTPTPTPAK